MTRQDGPSPSVVETVAGFTAGIVSTLSLHPLDLIKTRLQGAPYLPAYIPTAEYALTTTVDRSSYSRVGGSLRMIRDIAQHEGGAAALYRGLTPNLVGNSSSWAIYFLCYGNIKDAMRRLRFGGQEELTSWNYFAASGTAGNSHLAVN